jgi:hypothetical protein
MTTTFTPYAIHKLVNGLRAEAGLGPIAPQMMYNYSRNGMLGHAKVEQEDGRKININHTYTEDEVRTYLNKYATKLGLTIQVETVDENQMTIDEVDPKVQEAFSKAISK